MLRIGSYSERLPILVYRKSKSANPNSKDHSPATAERASILKFSTVQNMLGSRSKITGSFYWSSGELSTPPLRYKPLQLCSSPAKP